MDKFWQHVERLLEGVTDDGWQHLDDELITTCYHAPCEWIPLMKRIAVAADYVQEVFYDEKCLDDVCYTCMHDYMVMHDAIFICFLYAMMNMPL